MNPQDKEPAEVGSPIIRLFNELATAPENAYLRTCKTSKKIPDQLQELVTQADDFGSVASKLLLEWPHADETERDKCAYYASPAHGRTGRVTKTTWGRYLKRLIPDLADHDAASTANAIRNSLAVNGEFRIITDMKQMLEALWSGPRTCMSMHTNEYASAPHHPYEVYDPALGWGLAVREQDGRVVSRALVFEDETDKCFVRTFGRNDSTGYSHSCEPLRAWLESQGYEFISSWPEGTPLRLIEHESGSYVAPYLDGHRTNVNADEKNAILRINTYGGYDCDCTNGLANDDDDYYDDDDYDDDDDDDDDDYDDYDD